MELRTFRDGEKERYAVSYRFGGDGQIGDVGLGFNTVVLDDNVVLVFDTFGDAVVLTDFRRFDNPADARALVMRIVDAPLVDDPLEGEGYPDAWAAIADEMEKVRPLVYELRDKKGDQS